MKKLLTAAAALIAGAVLTLTASPAMARVDVGVNIGVPGVYAPAPVYVPPPTVVVQPRPVYVPPAPVVVQPRPVYVQPAPVYVDRPYWRERHWQHHGPYGRGWDRDGDGVPNRYDRRPNNPYRY
jgi:hypothetical protein